MEGEQHVTRLIEDRGWQVVARNFRTRFGEIDVIALDVDVLVFVEVRARTGNLFLADETVTRPKLQRLTSTAQAFIEQNSEYADHYWRIDFFALTLDRAGKVVACRQYENLTLD